MEIRPLRALTILLAATIGLFLAAGPAGAKPSQSSLRNPILPLDATGDDSPDPWVFRHDGRYWINYTSNGQLVYRSAPRLGALADAPERRIWPPEGQTEPADRSQELWAPETHRVNGGWFVYYTASGGSDDFGNHRMYVLESRTKSPAGPYEFKAELALPQPFAIDGTLLRLNGRLYLAYSGGPGFTPTSIYLAELSNPWTVKGLPLLISSPDYGWEREIFPINEGPELLTHGNRIHIIYSASWCGSGLYALGRLTVSKRADLMDPATWASAKYPDPVFETDASRGVFGPGHGSFFTTGGGKEFWNVYHATEEAGKGCFTGGLRTTRVQRFTWNRDGSPDFGRPVSLSTDIRAPKLDRTIAIQAESSKFSSPGRVSRLDERRFFGYAGVTLLPRRGVLPAMKFRLAQRGRYQVYLRVLDGPDAGTLTLTRPDGTRVSPGLPGATKGAIELDMGTMRIGRGLRTLRLRAATPVALDQIRLQPQPTPKRKSR
ncbi:MAG: glycoside hydrolase family 43 protein [Solirubrobacterales bacterium]|nr:glycoside hydrolase family 43 protein [Solirubrobacterales bacterium]